MTTAFRCTPRAISRPTDRDSQAREQPRASHSAPSNGGWASSQARSAFRFGWVDMKAGVGMSCVIRDAGPLLFAMARRWPNDEKKKRKKTSSQVNHENPSDVSLKVRSLDCLKLVFNMDTVVCRPMAYTVHTQKERSLFYS